MQLTTPFNIYNASAGSGKTYRLVMEFLKLLIKNPDPYAFTGLLAITFTNKASNEMKSRIVEKLKDLSAAGDNNAELLKYVEETGVEAKEIKARAKKILTAILHNYGLFSVSTIDKFNLRLMRSFSQDLGLSVNFDVEMNSNQVYSESVDLMFSELHENKLLAEILSDIALNNMAEGKKWDITGEVIKSTENLMNDRFLEEIQTLQNLSLEDLQRFRKNITRNYFGIRESMIEIANGMLDIFNEHNLSNVNFKSKSNGILSFFTKITKRKFETPTATQIKIIEEGNFFDVKSEHFGFLNSTIATAVMRITDHLSEFYLLQKIYKDLNTITIINEIEKYLNTIKSENNILLIGEFNKIIGDSIKEQPAPFIYEKIGSRYKHYFIDEFQDTSDLQYNNLIPLLENALAENQPIIIVGDPKQSIYRWRGGNPDLMVGLTESGDERIKLHELDTNWRSHEEIIQFNNNLYRDISRSVMHPSYQQLYENAKQNFNSKKGGFVQLRLLDKPVKGSGESFIDYLLEKLLIDIRHAESKGFKWEEMAILTLSRSQGRSVAEFLTLHGYRIISGESLLLVNSDQVQLLIAFIQYLTNPGLVENRVNLMLRMNQNQKIPAEDISIFIKEGINKSEPEFLTYLAQAGIHLEAALMPYQSFYEQVSAALRAFNLNENGNAYITFFMDEILKFQNQQDPAPHKFLEFWEQNSKKLSITVPEGENAIQLMTIHKSKGLQFQVLFLPMANWEVKESGIWIPVEDEKVDKFYISDFKNKESMPAQVLELMEGESFQSEMDILNLLYVATTRAVEQLYITTQNNPKGKPVISYLNEFAAKHGLTGEGIVTFGSAERVSEFHEEDTGHQQVIPFFSYSWHDKVKISREHALLWDENRYSAIDYGNKMHAVLEKIQHISDMSEVLEIFRLQGFISGDEKTQIAEQLNQLFLHQKLQQVFTSMEFLNEREFVASNGKIFIPDRLAKTDEGWILVDYKTGEHKKSYEIQLEFYSSELKNLGFDISKKYIVYLSYPVTVQEV